MLYSVHSRLNIQSSFNQYRGGPLMQANHQSAARGADLRRTMGGLSTLDLAVIIAYLAGITAFGLYVSRRVKDTEGFFMGNRRFGKSLMIAQALTTGTRADYAKGAALTIACITGVSETWIIYVFFRQPAMYTVVRQEQICQER